MKGCYFSDLLFLSVLLGCGTVVLIGLLYLAWTGFWDWYDRTCERRAMLRAPHPSTVRRGYNDFKGVSR